MFLVDTPGAARPRTPCGTFCPATKGTKNAPEPMVLDSFSGGVRGRAAGLLDRRSLRICRPPSAALALVELRLPAFQRGTAVQGARGLTEHASNSHPYHQTFVPSAARQPGSPAGCRDGRCREAAMTSLGRAVRRSKHWHRPSVRTIDRESEGRSENNIPP